MNNQPLIDFLEEWIKTPDNLTADDWKGIEEAVGSEYQARLTEERDKFITSLNKIKVKYNNISASWVRIEKLLNKIYDSEVSIGREIEKLTRKETKQ